LAIRNEHVNLSNEQRYCKVEETDVLVPPRAVLVAKGKNGRPRVLPLNRTAQIVFSSLLEDATTKGWLLTSRNGKQMKAIKKGFTAACARAGIEDLRAYDLRHTFATRLLERGVHHFIISALLGAPLRWLDLARRYASLQATLTELGERCKLQSRVSRLRSNSNKIWIVAKSGQIVGKCEE
jgi:integrase